MPVGLRARILYRMPDFQVALSCVSLDPFVSWPYAMDEMSSSLDSILFMCMDSTLQSLLVLVGNGLRQRLAREEKHLKRKFLAVKNYYKQNQTTNDTFGKKYFKYVIEKRLISFI